MKSIQDQLNRTVNFSNTPQRIISLVPSQTELLCDLGLEDSIVGITKFCVHPARLKSSKKIVGGTKQIHIDKIKALQPDIILCNKEENTEAIVAACEQICNVHVSDIFEIEDCLEMIDQYGSIFNKEDESKRLQSQIQNELLSFQEYIKQHAIKRVSYFIWKDPWMVAAKNTFVDYMLRINKFENIFGELERYPEVNLNQLKSLNPELILLSSEPFPFKVLHVQEFQNVFPYAKIIIVDGEMFSWYGSRLKKAFNYFKDLRNNL